MLRGLSPNAPSRVRSVGVKAVDSIRTVLKCVPRGPCAPWAAVIGAVATLPVRAQSTRPAGSVCAVRLQRPHRHRRRVRTPLACVRCAVRRQVRSWSRGLPTAARAVRRERGSSGKLIVVAGARWTAGAPATGAGPCRPHRPRCHAAIARAAAAGNGRLRRSRRRHPVALPRTVTVDWAAAFLFGVVVTVINRPGPAFIAGPVVVRGFIEFLTLEGPTAAVPGPTPLLCVVVPVRAPSPGCGGS